MSAPKQTSPAGVRLAVAGAETLKGRELKEVLESGSHVYAALKLLGDETAAGLIEDTGGEAALIQNTDVWQFDDVDIVFFAGSAAFTHLHWQQAREYGNRIVDLSYALEGQAAPRSPWLELELGREPEALRDAPVYVLAHPAAVVLALLLSRLSRCWTLRSSCATIFEPASERDREGMEELHQQTLKLLNFQSLPTEVFGRQSAFNLIASLGEEVKPTLAEVTARIERHFRQLLGDNAALPPICVVQAPVFHGHVFSIFVELEKETTVAELAESLLGPHTVHAVDGPWPGNVDAAGDNQIQFALRPADATGRRFWLWAAADNLRIHALQAAEAAEGIAAALPRGGVQ
jgi:aspartate-semialdehyde dehydrogenase